MDIPNFVKKPLAIMMLLASDTKSDIAAQGQILTPEEKEVQRIVQQEPKNIADARQAIESNLKGAMSGINDLMLQVSCADKVNPGDANICATPEARAAVEKLRNSIKPKEEIPELKKQMPPLKKKPTHGLPS